VCLSAIIILPIRGVKSSGADSSITGNIPAFERVHRAREGYWRKMLSSRSWQGEGLVEAMAAITERFPLL
jgi:hypothetical protein